MESKSQEVSPVTARLGICTSVFGHRHALSPDKIRRLAETDIGWIEVAALQSQHLNIFDSRRVDELADVVSPTSLRVWSVHAPFCGLAMDDPDTRQDGVRKLVQAMRVAERFGAGTVVVHPGRDVPSLDRRREIEWTREGIAAALQSAPTGVTLALETMGLTSLCGPAEEMLQVLGAFPASGLGVCLDTGHVNTGGDVPAYIRRAGERIVTVHLHDNHGDRDAHGLPGEGNVDWPAVLKAFDDARYSGPLMGECGDEGLPAVETAREYARRMVGYGC